MAKFEFKNNSKKPTPQALNRRINISVSLMVSMDARSFRLQTVYDILLLFVPKVKLFTC